MIQKVVNKKQKIKGFTLIELMVSISIFSIIMLTALGSFVITVNVAKKARALRTAMDNVSFAMESMSRSIRMGTNYYCSNTFTFDDTTSTSNCSGGNMISFLPSGGSTGTRVGYQKSGTTIKRYDEKNKSGVSITSSDVTINTLNFFVNGADSSAVEIAGPGAKALQGSVFIMVKGSVTVKGVPTPFNIQTLASERNF